MARNLRQAAPTGVPVRMSSRRLVLNAALGVGPVGTVCWRRSGAEERVVNADTESVEGGAPKRRETSFVNVLPASAAASLWTVGSTRAGTMSAVLTSEIPRARPQ